jgi:hypothetical protein
MRHSFACAVTSVLALSTCIAAADDDACIAASQVSLTLRYEGKLHDAIKQLAVCADPSCPDVVKAECTRRLDVARRAMPSLVLAAKDGAGNDLTVVAVTMDGTPLLSTLDGQALSIDPGEHTFRFEVRGQSPVEKKLILREGEKDRNEVVVLGPPPPAARPTAPSPSWSTNKTLALVSAGVGVVGVGLGFFFGAYAKSSQNQENTCVASSCNPAQSQEDYLTAKQNATASTVSLIVGAAFVAGGAVLWLTAPSPNRGRSAARARSLSLAPTVLGARGGGLVLGGDL